MTHRRPRWLIATLLVAGVGLLPTGCGADPTLQRQESSVLARTCASLRERNGNDPAVEPPAKFMLDFVHRTPHDDHGPMTKEELGVRCGTSPSSPSSASTTVAEPRSGARP